MAEKTKQVKEHTRRLRNGKVVKVRAHTAKYDAAEDEAKEASKKKGAGKEFESVKSKDCFSPMGITEEEWRTYDEDGSNDEVNRKVEAALKNYLGDKAYEQYGEYQDRSMNGQGVSLQKTPKQAFNIIRRFKNGEGAKVMQELREAYKAEAAPREAARAAEEAQRMTKMRNTLTKKLLKSGYTEYDSPLGKFYFKGDTTTGKGRYATIGGDEPRLGGGRGRTGYLQINRGLHTLSKEMFKSIVSGKYDEYVQKNKPESARKTNKRN